MVDRYGLALTAHSPLAVQHYDAGVTALLSERPGASALIAEAVALDPGFAAAHAALALVRALHGRPGEARAPLARATDLSIDSTDRERALIAIIATALTSRTPRARLHRHLAAYPRDVLALFLALHDLFTSGHPDRWRHSLSLLHQVAPAYGDDWYLHGAFAFACEESGDLVSARTHALRSLALAPANANAIHCLAHIDAAEARAAHTADTLEPWLSRAETPTAYRHLWWHLAMSAYCRGERDRAAELYATHIEPVVRAGASPFALVDAVQLLWRTRLDGWDADAEWEPVRALARRVAARSYTTPVVAVHAALALADDVGGLAALRATWQDRAAAGDTTARVVLRAITGLAAHARGHHADAVVHLAAAERDATQLGATGEQRSIVVRALAASLQAQSSSAASASR